MDRSLYENMDKNIRRSCVIPPFSTREKGLSVIAMEDLHNLNLRRNGSFDIAKQVVKILNSPIIYIQYSY